MAGGVAGALFVPVIGLAGLIPASYGGYRLYQNKTSNVRILDRKKKPNNGAGSSKGKQKATDKDFERWLRQKPMY